MDSEIIIKQLREVIEKYVLEAHIFADAGDLIVSYDILGGYFDPKEAIYIYLEDGAFCYDTSSGKWKDPVSGDANWLRILPDCTVEFLRGHIDEMSSGDPEGFIPLFKEDNEKILLDFIEYMIRPERASEESLELRASELINEIYLPFPRLNRSKEDGNVYWLPLPKVDSYYKRFCDLDICSYRFAEGFNPSANDLDSWDEDELRCSLTENYLEHIEKGELSDEVYRAELNEHVNKCAGIAALEANVKRFLVNNEQQLRPLYKSRDDVVLASGPAEKVFIDYLAITFNMNCYVPFFSIDDNPEHAKLLGRYAYSLTDGVTNNNSTLTIPCYDDQIKRLIELKSKYCLLSGNLKKLEQEVSRSLTVSSELNKDHTSYSSYSNQFKGILSSIGRFTLRDEIRLIIHGGESKTAEFKESLSLDVRKGTKEKYIETSALKTVSAFLNTDGGTLLVGVNDSGEVTGIGAELKNFHRESSDKFLLHFKNIIRARIGEHFYPFLDYNLVKMDNEQLLQVTCKQSDKACYMDGSDFYVRTNPATDKLEGPKLVAYVNTRFK